MDLSLLNVTSTLTGLTTTKVTKFPYEASLEQEQRFLRLLATQFTYQNPLEPMTNENFSSQVTQFSILGELITLNKAMETLLRQRSLIEAVGLIGKKVYGVDSQTGEKIEGVVTKIRVEDGLSYLRVGEKSLSLLDVTRVEDIKNLETE